MSILEKELMKSEIPLFTYKQMKDIVYDSVMNVVIDFEEWTNKNSYHRVMDGFIKKEGDTMSKIYTIKEVYQSYITLRKYDI